MILNGERKVRIIKLQKVCALAWWVSITTPTLPRNLLENLRPAGKADKMTSTNGQQWTAVFDEIHVNFVHFEFNFSVCCFLSAPVSRAAGVAQAPLKRLIWVMMQIPERRLVVLNLAT